MDKMTEKSRFKRYVAAMYEQIRRMRIRMWRMEDEGKEHLEKYKHLSCIKEGLKDSLRTLRMYFWGDDFEVDSDYMNNCIDDSRDRPEWRFAFFWKEIEKMCKLDKLDKLIKESEWILELDYDFDGAYSPDYSRETLDVATGLLRKLMIHMRFSLQTEY